MHLNIDVNNGGYDKNYGVFQLLIQRISFHLRGNIPDPEKAAFPPFSYRLLFVLQNLFINVQLPVTIIMKLRAFTL